MNKSKKTERQFLREVERMLAVALDTREPRLKAPKPLPPVVCSCTPAQRASDEVVPTCRQHNGLPF
jgi:hypothetical protein